jgi:hypothetical protein
MSEIEDKNTKLPWIKSPSGVSDIYSNNVHVTWTLDDVRLRIGQIVDNPETPTPGDGFKGAVEERAALTFTWRNAKLIRDQLTKLIDSYEKINGEINVDVTLPPSTN